MSEKQIFEALNALTDLVKDMLETQKKHNESIRALHDKIFKLEESIIQLEQKTRS